MTPYQTLLTFVHPVKNPPERPLSTARKPIIRLQLTDLDPAVDPQEPLDGWDLDGAPEGSTFSLAKAQSDEALKHGYLLRAADATRAMFRLAATQLEQGIAYNSAGGVHKLAGDEAAAQLHYEAAAAKLQGDARWRLAVQNNLANLAIRRGQHGTARALSDAVLSSPQARPYRKAWARMNLGELALQTQQLDAALLHFGEAVQHFQTAQIHRLQRLPNEGGESPELLFALAYLSFTRGLLGEPRALADLQSIATEAIDADPETALTATLLLAQLTGNSQTLEVVADAAAALHLFSIHNLCQDLLRSFAPDSRARRQPSSPAPC